MLFDVALKPKIETQVHPSSEHGSHQRPIAIPYAYNRDAPGRHAHRPILSLDGLLRLVWCSRLSEDKPALVFLGSGRPPMPFSSNR